MRPRTDLARPSGFLTKRGAVALVLLACSGCLVPPHDSFATPEDTVLTFQSAFARDDEFKEYDCFATGMKQETGLDQQKWSVARVEVFRPFGALGRFVLRRNSLVDNLVGGTRGEDSTRLVYELFGNGLEVELVPEAVLVLPDPVSQREGAWTLSKRSAFVMAGGSAEPSFLAVIEVEQALAERYVADGIPWAELRHHWKVRTVAARPDDAGPPPALPAAPAERGYTVRVPSIRPTALRASLGVVTLHLALPVPIEDDRVRTHHVMPRIADRLRWEAGPPASP